MQAVATSIDALAVGVTLKMAELSAVGLAGGALLATLCIGIITFLLSVGAVYIGKALGDKLTDKAELFGGLVLIAIGLKILIESFL
jgi:putative Mn2+ efflux pump MntP